MLLSYLETAWSVWVLLLRFARWNWRHFISGLIIPHYRGKTLPSEYSTWCSMNYEASQSGWWERHPNPLDRVLSDPSGDSFPSFRLFTVLHALTSTLLRTWRGSSVCLGPLSGQFSPILCPWTPAIISLISQSLLLSAESPPVSMWHPCRTFRNSLEAESWRSPGHASVFPIHGISLLLPDIQCPENHCFTGFLLFVCFFVLY